MRWSWPLDAWRILINPIRSWYPWSRRILDPLIFIKKPSLNRNWILFILHKKRKPAPEKKTDSALENALISQLIPSISRLIFAISRLISYIVDYCIILSLYFCLCICHAPLPKIQKNGVTTRVGDVYTRENTSRIYAKLKVTWTSI